MIWNGHKHSATVMEVKILWFLILTPFFFPLHLYYDTWNVASILTWQS